jgi:hypothetical protein
MIDKFTNQDRKLVLKELEKIQRTSLLSTPNSRKLFSDKNGKFYCIFGGTGDWHGISESLMNQLEAHSSTTLLVVAKKYSTRIDLCVSTAEKMVKNKAKMPRTQTNGYQFHLVAEEDGFHVTEIPRVQLKKISEIVIPHVIRRSSIADISRIININLLPTPQTLLSDNESVTHSDIQAKLLLIGSYLGFRTFTPDRSKESRYGKLGGLSTEEQVPPDYLALRQIGVVRNIDVLWFDDEGMPTHCFEVEHTTDVTKGLLRLYQIRKLRIKMFIVAPNGAKKKFDTELNKDPFRYIQEEFVFRSYRELEEFFESVRRFATIKESFLMDKLHKHKKSKAYDQTIK